MKRLLSVLIALVAGAVCIAVSVVPSAAKAAVTEGNAVFKYFWSNEPGVQQMPVSEGAAETYAASSRSWQGLPTIAVTERGRLWCAWQTGDTVEGSAGTDNYDVLYYSDDGGATWSDNYMIWDSATDSIRLTDPRLFVDHNGQLRLILIRGGGNGTYSVVLENPDCEDPSTQLRVSAAVNWLKYPPAHRVTALSNGLYITPVEAGVTAQHTYICRPGDGAWIWTDQQASGGTPAVSTVPSKSFGEAQIIELTDGRLMMLSRLTGDKGGIEISYSSDWGYNWTPFRTGFDEPYIGPSSKWDIRRLESGAILMLNHASSTSRSMLTAYLSYDEGKTYPYRMTLDDRDLGKWGVSYPEAAAQQGPDGEIYIVYDAGRYEEKEIRLCILTEEDIKAGKPVGETSAMRIPVSRLGSKAEFVSAAETYERYPTVEKNTPKQDVLTRLPSSLTLTDDTGRVHTLRGEWKSAAYASDRAGVYAFDFETQIPADCQDGLGLTRVYVTVRETPPPAPPANGRGCAGAVGFGSLGAVLAAGGIACLLLRRKTPGEKL